MVQSPVIVWNPEIRVAAIFFTLGSGSRDLLLEICSCAQVRFGTLLRKEARGSFISMKGDQTIKRVNGYGWTMRKGAIKRDCMDVRPTWFRAW